MADELVKLKIVNENEKSVDQSLNDEVEMIFGRGPAPALNDKKQIISNGNLIDKERSTEFNGNNNVGETELGHPRQPLLERRGGQLPPLAGPETDELDGDPPKDAAPFPGADVSLLHPGDKKPGDHNHDESDRHSELDPSDKHSMYGDDAATDDVNELAARFGDSRPVSPFSAIALPDVNVNTYQQKKNLAQGMMDLALLSANANQLRYVLESASTHPYYYPSLTFISLSIIFQIMVGVGLIMNSRYDVNHQKERCKADKINNMTVIGIFLITIVNVFITSFSVATTTGVATVGTPTQQAG
ncbi:ninjurin-A isoform X2 [Spodoptera frugiperda]|uniref:Ninjurin-A isoform X2 n=1 Tax=Spodoptera frugiperda TaxID=7108 RepID=A0A9R0D2I8_SPOFR|nr:ninjurin-A isoform X2 [Spodoptera frugiperda]